MKRWQLEWDNGECLLKPNLDKLGEYIRTSAESLTRAILQREEELILDNLTDKSIIRLRDMIQTELDRRNKNG